ncbi:MAG: enoyl-CoA hydratase-related protein [Syntrophorhabdales bacterium]|jgi:enoyl-CoA hydratase/carnithine racemase
MENGVVIFEKEEHIGWITINRPEVKNALNTPVFSALNDVLDLAGSDRDVRVIIVTGKGATFVAGADVDELRSFDSLNGWSASRFSQSVLNKLERIGKPSLAAINGPALGGGLELALACTYRVASAEAKVGFPELSLGIIPGFGGTQRLVRCVGHAKAAELLLTSSIITGEEALRIGLVNSVVARDHVREAARSVARSISRVSPDAVRLTMSLLLHGQTEGFDTGLALESALAALTLSSSEAKRLLHDFGEKKKEV